MTRKNPQPLRRSALLPLLAAVAVAAACGDRRPASTSPAPAPASSPATKATTPAPPPAPCIDEGEGPEPSAAALRTFVHQRARKLRECYERVLKRDASARGKVTFRFTIDRCGKVTDVQVASRSGNVGDAADCALHLIQRWQTPFNPAEPVAIEYPIAFSASM